MSRSSDSTTLAVLTVGVRSGGVTNRLRAARLPSTLGGRAAGTVRSSRVSSRSRRAGRGRIVGSQGRSERERGMVPGPGAWRVRNRRVESLGRPGIRPYRPVYRLAPETTKADSRIALLTYIGHRRAVDTRAGRHVGRPPLNFAAHRQPVTTHIRPVDGVTMTIAVWRTDARKDGRVSLVDDGRFPALPLGANGS